ncbi:MAG: AAA family ATPase [Microscillaceae bacterium]|nr:AAA family ATPase [Microscillaceae bacterium]
MKKRFNITGSCNANEHYMMDDRRRFAGILQMVELGDYFVINRPRQFGKTTMLFALLTTLREDERFLPVFMSFQGTGLAPHQSDTGMINLFLDLFIKGLRIQDKLLSKEISQMPRPEDFGDLSDMVSEIVEKANKKIVLLIDEVDDSSVYEAFLRLLGMFRNKYLARNAGELTFHSIVLAGVHDIKSLKFKLRNPDDAQVNSPWNIAADFNVVMEFYPDEIAYMLRQYSEAEGVQMDFEAIAERLYYHTSGYPFLVSKLCKNIAEYILPKREDKSKWTLEEVEASVQLLLKENNTNFDSLIKSLENNEKLYNLVYRVIVEGEVIPFNPDSPLTNLGRIYGIFGEGHRLVVHNRIYAQRIYNYMTVKRIESEQSYEEQRLGDQFTTDEGSLDLERVLRKFQSFMKEQYSSKNSHLIEREWRLIFLAFLKPIINGQGHDFKEVETSEEKRLDIVLTYLHYKYIIELKLWRGEKAHQKGLHQLAGYLEKHSLSQGYLLIFDDRKQPSWKEEIISHEGKEIFAVWV